MLALTVKPGESVMVGEAKITIGKNGRFYVDAPKSVRVVRCSILEKANGKESHKKETSEKGRREEG
jgi:sRNA-binding carbon storage regulator CsrA